MFKISISLLISVSIFAYGCQQNNQSHGHNHDVIGGHTANEDAHSHGSHQENKSLTLVQDDVELFVEFPGLVKDHKSSFIAHLTDLDHYKPIDNGEFTVSLIQGNTGIRHKVPRSERNGIYTPALLPTSLGKQILRFEFSYNGKTIKFEDTVITVINEDEESMPVSEDHSDEETIFFSKEQAWKTEFATKKIDAKEFYSIIRTTGTVKPDQGAENILNASIAGKVSLQKFEGEIVKKGQLLAIIYDSGIEDNFSSKLEERKIAFEKSRKDYFRLIPLMEKQLITRPEFIEAEAKYKKDSVLFFQMSNRLVDKRMQLHAPFNGYVKQVLVDNGSYVKSGASVISVTREKNLIVEAWLNSSDLVWADEIFDANFRPSGQQKVISLSDLNGNILERKRRIPGSKSRMGFPFRIQNNELLFPGMLVEVFLKHSMKDDVLVVPQSAIIEEHGNYFVFEQIGGETYVRRDIGITQTDGLSAEIKSGLKGGETIVTEGAYQIRLASMAGDLPIHGHTH